MSGIRLENVSKAYGASVVVDRLNLEVKDREFVVLVGPSGCGKTTTLRMLAGLEEVTAFGALVIIDVWEWTPFLMLIMLAGAHRHAGGAYRGSQFGRRQCLADPLARPALFP